MQREPLELYIHIPFCVKKCLYCDFLSFGTEDERLKDTPCLPSRKEPVPQNYIEALCREIGEWGRKKTLRHRPVISVFFGGGTPSLMSEKQIFQVMAALRGTFSIQRNAEITMESNPGTLALSKLKAMRFCGINRLSIGLQSTSDEELKMLGRIHSYGAFLQSFKWAREAGFHNINVDLMTALPNQTEESYRQTLKQVLLLEPEHISAYSLIIEPDTPFEKMEEEGKLNLPDEDSERRMYYMTKAMLAKAGYHRYEISNYARPGYECRHNIGYWRRSDYLGLGLGASGLIGNHRFTNPVDMSVYVSGHPGDNLWFSDTEELSRDNAMEEFMFLGLRMLSGVSEIDFKKCFDEKLMKIYGDAVRKNVAAGLLKRKNRKIFLTDLGLDVANQVMTDFLLD